MNRRKVVDYRILTEFRDPVDRRRLVKVLQFVVMEFLKEHPEYELLGGPYVNNSGLECQAVVKYEAAKRESRKVVPLPPEIAEFVDRVNKAYPAFIEEE